MNELITAIVEDLTLEVGDAVGFSTAILQSKVTNAYNEVKAERRYPKNYTDEMILSDMSQFYNVIRNVALYDFNSIGKDFEQAHTENGISRSFVARSSLFDVTPIARF